MSAKALIYLGLAWSACFGGWASVEFVRALHSNSVPWAVFFLGVTLVHADFLGANWRDLRSVWREEIRLALEAL